MKRFFVPIIIGISLTLSACGGTKSAKDAGADSVEMPAEEAMDGLDAAATPVVDPNANTISLGNEPVLIPDSAAKPEASSALPAPTMKSDVAKEKPKTSEKSPKY